jgi:LysR family transcriptional regulator, regulator for genes of the gallate degradation pathway
MATRPRRPPLNLRHLAVAREVARRGGVNAAARALYLSQPAATQAVAAVEAHFGAPLFDRQPGGMSPTAAGRICLARIERALEALRAGAADVLRPAAAAPGLRGMTSAQLDALIAVVQHGGFAGAARHLGVARPTLHRAARALERATRHPLFEQTSFGIRATRDGERLAQQARLAFAEVDQARAELASLAGVDAGRTVIGVMPLARSFLVPKAVLGFLTVHPAHTVALLDGSYDSLLGALRMGTADILVGALRDPPPADDVVEEPLFDDPLAIVVRAGHPLADRRRPTVAALLRYPWIAARPGSPLRRQFDELFTHAGATPPGGLIECNSLVAARALLLGSDRAMLLSEHQIGQDRAAGLLTALPHPAGRVVRRIGLTLRRNWRPTGAQRVLLELLRTAAAELPGCRPGSPDATAGRSLRPHRSAPVRDAGRLG